MPFTYTIHPELNLVRETWSGEVTVEQLRELSLQEWADPLYRENMNTLSDFSRAQVNISFEEMSDYAKFLTGNEHAGRQAIVVGRQLEYGLARMFELLTEGEPGLWESLRIFFDFEEAEHWACGDSGQK